jgi:hypothetical protein
MRATTKRIRLEYMHQHQYCISTESGWFIDEENSLVRGCSVMLIERRK